MTLGPAIGAVGVALLARVPTDASYVTDVLPGVVVLGTGLTLLVTPLTATVLAAAPGEHTGLASGVNNAVARAAGLLAVAALPAVVGLTGEGSLEPGVFGDAYPRAMWWCVGLMVLGAASAAVLVPGRREAPSSSAG